ncbi:hypothetical protein AYI69_g5034, partial [Smittium culicis]
MAATRLILAIFLSLLSVKKSTLTLVRSAVIAAPLFSKTFGSGILIPSKSFSAWLTPVWTGARNSAVDFSKLKFFFKNWCFPSHLL